jgi:hypothetical protein
MKISAIYMIPNIYIKYVINKPFLIKKTLSEGVFVPYFAFIKPQLLQQ